VSTQVLPLFAGLVDDAAVFPPGSATLPDAVAAHRRHRTSWYAELIGPLLVPASALPELAGLLDSAHGSSFAPRGGTPDRTRGTQERIEVGVIGDVPLDQLDRALAGADPRIVVRQLEAAVARRGEDPAPADRADLARRTADGLDVYAELPLTWD
jgi:hypothetical protein